MFFSVFFIFYFLIFTLTFAQAPASPNDDFLGVQDFTVTRIANIITGFACWLIGIVLAVMVVFLVWSGILFFLARGNETAVVDARKNLTWTLVGILVILATNVIIATVANALGADYSFIPLNCGLRPRVTTEENFTICTRNSPECPAGFICTIESGQEAGFCLGE